MDDAKELEAIEQARLLNATAEYAKAELICRAGLENSQLSLANKTQWQLILIESLRRRGLIQEALPLAQEVFEWSGVTGIPRDRAMALSYLANLHYFLGAFSSAIDCYTLAIQLFESINDTERLAVVTSNLAVVFTDTAQHDKALEYYQKALNILALGTNDEAKANTIGNIGNVYMNLGDYAKALDAYTEAYELHHQAGRDAEASIFLGNIGNVYATVSDYTKALDYYHQTLRIHESIDDSASIARIVGNIGIVYLELKMFDKALEFYEKALAIHKHIGDAAGEARVLGNMGTVYQSLAQPEKSIECLLEAKAMNEEIGNPDGVADMVGSLGISYRDAGDFEKALECTIQGIALHEALRARSDVAIGKSHLATLYSTADTDYYDPDKSELLLKEAIEVCTELGTTNLSSGMYAKLADLYQQTSEWEKCVSALRMHQELQSQLQTEDAANRALQHDSQRKLEDSERDRRVKLARFQEQEKVLNNILPENITLRLIKGEKTIADHFDCVSVLFMDIVGFTPLASSVSAQELVLLLNTIFSAADAVMREFGLEKIKTIGDAYMAVAGAPHVQDDHAYRAAKAALGLRDAMQHTFQTFPETHGNAEWTQLIPKVNVRIGVHCGPVAAGVVGEIKFLYDLWGDAVNTAARMESHGQARRVHVSHDFMCEVLTQQPKLHELSFEDRGEMEIKGKGDDADIFLGESMTLDDLKSQLTQAEVAEDIGNYDEAERLSQQILVELSSGGYADLTDSERSALGAGATCMLGVVSWRRGAYTPALEQLYAALHISQQVRDNAGAAKVLGCIGTVYWSLNDYSKALEFYSDSLSIELELGNESGIAKQLGSIGLLHWNLCDYSKAMEYYVEALRIDEELGNKRGVARHLGNIGNVHWSFSDYPKALEFYSRALSIDEDLCNVSGVAIWLGNIGNVYMKLCNYSKALEYCGKALDIEQQLGNNAGVATWLSNIGNVHMDLSDYSKALTYYTMALRMEQEIGNKAREAMWLGNIGNVHLSLSDYSKALEYYLKVLSVDEALGNKLGMATWLGNIGLVYWYLSDYPKALEQYIRALNLCEEIGNVSGVATYLGNVGGVLMGLGDYEMAEDYLSRSLYVREQLGVKSELGELKAILGELYAIDANPNRDFAKAETFLLQSIAVAEELGTKKFDAHKTLAELYEKQERWEEAFYQQGKYFTLKEEVQSEEAKNAAQLMEQQKQIAEREKEIAIAKATAAAQMSATTTLLHKVLPESVATRMISGEVEIADYFTNVSILFADIAGFTPISADMPAIIVVRFLNYVFGEFDRIIKKHGCEKIKTIGDGYMAIAGAPLECADHAERLAAAALEMQETITLPESIREYMPSGVKLGVRIGLHTGSVVAGVIGEERFVYDIYSDAVNTAARMESHGEENKIHVSNDFFRHLQNRFAMTKNTTHGFVFEKRGEMEIKGKGMMRTYFLEKA